MRASIKKSGRGTRYGGVEPKTSAESAIVQATGAVERHGGEDLVENARGAGCRDLAGHWVGE
jgi:hypothetical protein